MRVCVVAGDPSGDAHAARLIAHLRHRVSKLELYGIGGPHLAREGLSSLAPFEQLTVSGFWEVARRYRLLRSIFNQACELIRRTRPDVFIPIDYPGFNIPLAEYARQQGVRVFWYIAPQLWAWGRWRLRRFAGAIDRLFVVLPFEVEFYHRSGIEAEFYGHPLLDEPAFAEPVYQRHSRVVALLPGSRPHEIDHHLPLMLKVAELLAKHERSLECKVALSQHKCVSAELLEPNTRQLLRQAAAGVVKAGTSTLEAALAGMPFVALYRTSPLSYWTARMLVQIPWIALPNIILGKKCVPEFIQHRATPHTIASHVLKLLTDEKLRHEQQKRFAELRQVLGGSGASERIAQRIVQLL